MSPVGKLRISSETAVRQRLCRACCIITNYSIHSPASAPETVSGPGQNTSRQALQQAKFPHLQQKPMGTSLGTSKWGAAQTPPWGSWQGYRAGHGSRGTSCVRHGGGGVPLPSGRPSHRAQLSISKQAPRAPVSYGKAMSPGGQSPISWSINLTQGFGGKSILFILKCLSYGHGMNWNTIFTKKQKHKILYWRQTLLDLQPPKLQTFIFALLYCQRLWGKNLRSNKRPGERWPGMEQRRGQVIASWAQ